MKPVTSFAKGTILSLLLTTCAAFTGCSDKAEELVPQGTRALDVQVKVQPTSRAMVKGTALAEGAGLGVNVTATDGGLYDGNDAGYLNILYTATGTGANQEWASTTPVMLSGTEGKMYAYYPHTPGVDFKAIAVDITTQHDWMYGAEAYTVSDKAATAAVVLKHAQTAVNVNVVRDATYTGVGSVSALSVTSEGLASGGTLDTRDGSWSALSGANTAISIINGGFTLDGTTKSSQENPYMFIPASVETKNFTVTATVDGKTYNSNVTMKEAFAKGKVYSVNLKMTNVGLTVSQVTLVDWDEVTLDEGTFQPEQPADPWTNALVATYYIDEPKSIEVMYSEFSYYDYIERMIVDGVEVTPNSTYDFESAGVHTVKFLLMDNTTIPYRMFRDYCDELVAIKIPNSVTTIGEAAFEGCEGLTSVTIPNSVTSIGNEAFKECGGLTEITIPNSVQRIGKMAFQNCSGLTEIIIPSSVLMIGKSAFAYCYELMEVTIGSGVTTIGEKAFYQCTGLTGITIPNSVTEIGDYAFYECSGITEVTIGSGVQTISVDMFRGCTGLTEVTIPKSVKTIGERAFYGCAGLAEVTIGSGVTTIGGFAFYECSKLAKITSLAMTAPTIDSHTFNDVPTGGTLYFPQGATGYDTWMQVGEEWPYLYYLGNYGWTLQEITEE